MSDFGNIIDTVTQDLIVPKVTDNILKGNVLTMRLLKNRRAAQGYGEVSGTSVNFPIKYQKSTQGGWYSGFDQFATGQTNTRVLASFTPKQLYWSVAVSGIQQAVNKGPQRVLDLLSTEMNSVADDMIDTLGDGVYSDGTGTSNKQLTGIKAAINDGNGTATYGGLSRATYTTWVSDLDSSANAVTLAELGASCDAATINGQHPTLIVTTAAIWATLEGLAMGTLTYNNPMGGMSREYGTMTDLGVKKGQTGEAGFTSLFFRGIPVVWDDKCTAGYIYLINENHLGLAMWPYPDFPGYVTKPEYNGFAWTGLKIPTNQDATVGQFLLYGQFVTDSCRLHSYMTGKS